MKRTVVFYFCLNSFFFCQAQNETPKSFTHADTLRGSIGSERSWWDVLRYDVTVKPDYANKSTTGWNKITYKAVADHHPNLMQIDLQGPLQIDSIVLDSSGKLTYTKEGNVWHVTVPDQKRLRFIRWLFFIPAKHTKPSGHPGTGAGRLPKIRLIVRG